MNKEKWVEEILQTAKGIRPVSSNTFLATRIEAKLQRPERVVTLPLQWVYVSAAVMLLLLLLNLSIWSSPVQSPRPSGVQQLVQEYGWSNDDLYSMNLSNRPHE